MEKKENHRFNQDAAKWHGLFWLILITLICLAWASLLSGCSTKKSAVSDSVQSSDSLVMRSSSIQQDSVVNDSVSVIASEKKHQVFVHDSTWSSQIIERTTIIRQDSSGRELSRETNTTITNNRDRFKKISEKDNDVLSTNINVNNNRIIKGEKNKDLVSAKKKLEDKSKVTVVKEQPSFWQSFVGYIKYILAISIGSFVVFRLLHKLKGNGKG